MACIIICNCTASITGKVTRRGSEPSKPVTWSVSAWFVMPDGVKHTHSATVPGQTVQSLVPVMGALIDSLIAEHGNDVQSAGWTATAHGKKKRK